MTHRQHLTNIEQCLAVMSAPLMACPNCGHGIDPHGTDPGGVCGVGDESRDRCPCLLSPNAIANLLLAAAWDEGHAAGCGDPYRRLGSCDCGPNPYRAAHAAAHSAAQGVPASQCGPDAARPADGIVSCTHYGTEGDER